jgi:Tfp pilus assembly pilus retraction ATPase PilT
MQQQPKIEMLLEEVVKRDASDLHLQVGLPPMIRVDGSLSPVQGVPVLNEDMMEALVFSLLDEDQKQILLRDKEFDFSFAFGDLGRFRVNAFHERGNVAAALRLIPSEIRTIEQIGMPPILNKFTEYPRGLVLVRSSLREDPDVVLIGEMRDLETIAAAITIAETGHLVFATLHTNSASQSIDRMVDVFPPHQQPQVRSQLGNMLQAICSQRLIPALAGGRIAAAEILVATPAVRNIIREGKNYQLEAVIQTGAEHGMQSMDRTLANLVHGGVISYEEARNYAVELEELDRLMRG